MVICCIQFISTEGQVPDGGIDLDGATLGSEDGLLDGTYDSEGDTLGSDDG